jgi:hypothetical protein
VVGRGLAWQAGLGMAGQGPVGFGEVWQAGRGTGGEVWLVWRGVARQGVARYGWRGTVGSG